MLKKNTGKRKRQTTLVDIFKRQRQTEERVAETRSGKMADSTEEPAAHSELETEAIKLDSNLSEASKTINDILTVEISSQDEDEGISAASLGEREDIILGKDNLNEDGNSTLKGLFVDERAKACSDEEKFSDDKRNLENLHAETSSTTEKLRDNEVKSLDETVNESDNETQEDDINMKTRTIDEIDTAVRLGVEFNSLLRAPECCGCSPVLAPSSSHTILFRPYEPSAPYPRAYRDKWDRHHVRMPCSKENLYPAPKLVSRWELICHYLRKPIASCSDLEDMIMAYNGHHANKWNFKLLDEFINMMSCEKQKEFFHFVLPGILRMALYLPEICTQAPPLLKRQKEHTITMTQQQVASLLANAFLCTFPRRNASVRNLEHEFSNYPGINFQKLFQSKNHQASRKKIEKLKCVVNYFKRILEQPPLGTISFKRQVLRPDETPKWHSCTRKLCRLRVCSEGTIEDNAPGLLQVDFANKFVGGGVLGEGCVQEEIRFSICPELIVARLFTECLEDNECLIVTGAERFSDYVGYARTFQWDGEHYDKTSRDSWGRLYTKIVAIDAKPYMKYSEQFSPAIIKRELEKAFCGFLSRNTDPKHLPAVATGKWGCGAFNGDPHLKSLIQIMAASAAQRDVLYFTFGDKEHARELYETHTFLRERNTTIADLWKLLNNFRRELSSESRIANDLFGYIGKVLGKTVQEHDVISTSTNDVIRATCSDVMDPLCNDKNSEDSPLLLEAPSSDEAMSDWVVIKKIDIKV